MLIMQITKNGKKYYIVVRNRNLRIYYVLIIKTWLWQNRAFWQTLCLCIHSRGVKGCLSIGI